MTIRAITKGGKGTWLNMASEIQKCTAASDKALDELAPLDDRIDKLPVEMTDAEKANSETKESGTQATAKNMETYLERSDFSNFRRGHADPQRRATQSNIYFLTAILLLATPQLSLRYSLTTYCPKWRSAHVYLHE